MIKCWKSAANRLKTNELCNLRHLIGFIWALCQERCQLFWMAPSLEFSQAGKQAWENFKIIFRITSDIRGG